MKRFFLLPFFLLAATLFLMPACSDDNEKLETIQGEWITDHSVTDVPIRLTFYSDGTFLWEPRIDTEEHSPSSGSYTFDDDLLTIFDDDDCPEITGLYTAIHEGATFNISVREDECEPRIVALTGLWEKE